MDPLSSTNISSDANDNKEPTTIPVTSIVSQPSEAKNVEGKESQSVQLSSSSIIIDIPSNNSRNQQQGPRKGSSYSVASSFAKGTTLLCFRMSDVAVSILVLLPLTIGMWRGIWQIMAAYAEPWTSILIGNSLLFGLYYFQEPLKLIVDHQKMNFALFYVVSRTLLFGHAFGAIIQWRGLWDLLDVETGEGTTSAAISLFVPLAIMIMCKEFCNVLATPLFVGVDEATSLVDCPLRFKTPVSSKWKYFLDCVWSVVIVQNLVISAWRGLWNLANIHLYPEDKVTCAYLSVATGCGIVIMLSVLQPCYFRFMIRQKGIMRLALFDLVTAWGFVGCVLAWKGTWDLQDLLIVFDQPLASEWLTTVIGTVGAILLGCLSTVTSRGVTVDGEDSGDGTVEWPISYVSLLQQKRHHGTPFPEPWLFRYLCTTQRLLMTEPLTLRRTSTVGPTKGCHSIQHDGKGDMMDTEDDHCPTRLIRNSIYVDHFDGPKNLQPQLKSNEDQARRKSLEAKSGVSGSIRVTDNENNIS